MGALIRQLRLLFCTCTTSASWGRIRGWRAGSSIAYFSTDHRSPPKVTSSARSLRPAPPLTPGQLAITKVFAVSQYGYRSITGLDVFGPKTDSRSTITAVDLTRAVWTTAPRRDSARASRSEIARSSRKFLDDSRERRRGTSSPLQHWSSHATARAFRVCRRRHALSSFQRQAGEMGLGRSPHLDRQRGGHFGRRRLWAAEIVCQMSRWEEVSALSSAEAMVSGKPRGSPLASGHPELIDDGQTGFLVIAAITTPWR